MVKIPRIAKEMGADALPACAPRPQPAPGAALAQTCQVEGRTGSRCAFSSYSALEDLRWANRVPEKGPQWVLPESSASGVVGQPEVAVTWKAGTWTGVTVRTSCPPSHIISIKAVSSDVFFVS